MSAMTKEEEERIRKELPHTTAALLASVMGRSRYAIQRKARAMGVTTISTPDMMPDHTALLLSNGHSELVEALKHNPISFRYHKGQYGNRNE